MISIKNYIILACTVCMPLFVGCNSDDNKQDTQKYDNVIVAQARHNEIVAAAADSLNVVSEEYDEFLKEFRNTYIASGDETVGDIVGIKKPYNISSACVEIIKKYEGCELSAYKYCNRKTGKREKYYTIGYGHVIFPGDKTPMRITKAHAERLLVQDLNKTYVPTARRLLNKIDKNFKVTQGFFDGFVSLVYNCGEKGIQKSVFWKRLKTVRFDKNGKIYKEDRDKMLQAIKTARASEPGHFIRRRHEYALMASNS